VPREHGLALGATLGEQTIVVAPESDLQQLPAENLRQCLGDDLALQRIHALAERAAQPRMQVWAEVVVHARRIAPSDAHW
jgi:hypothetical protein